MAKMARGKKSIVWEFFSDTKENGKVVSVHCKHCSATYKYFGNTTNLHDHVKRKHPILLELQALQTPPPATPAVKHRQNTSPADGNSQQTAATSLSTESLSTPAVKRRKKMKLCVSATSDPTDDERNEFEKDLLQMIAVDWQPLSIVENRGFKSFAEKYLPHHKLPSAKILSENVLPEVYRLLSSNLRNMLEKIEHLSVTTEVWTYNSNRTYITVTAHFVFEFKIHSFVLSTEEVQPAVNITQAVNIAQVVSKILDKWQVSDKVVTVVTTSGADMMKAVADNLRKCHQPCVADNLNLSVFDAVRKNEGVKIILAKCRSLVSYFKQNSAASKLKEVQERMGLPELNPKEDVPTRWHSAVLMMERLAEIKAPLSAALSSLAKAPSFLDSSEWEVIYDCVNVLKPVLFMAEDLTGEMYPTVSRITPLIKGLQIKIKNKNVTTEIGKHLKSSLLETIARRVGLLETRKAVAIATFLDPRFKKAAFGNAANADNAEKWVTEELCGLIDNSEDNNARRFSGSSVTASDDDELWSHFDEKVSAISSAVTTDANAVLMIKQYLELPYFDRKKDPFEFWKLYFSTFPELYLLASKYLHVPAVHAPSERIFGKAGVPTDDRRNRLGPNKLDELLFISQNVRLTAP